MAWQPLPTYLIGVLLEKGWRRNALKVALKYVSGGLRLKKEGSCSAHNSIIFLSSKNEIYKLHLEQLSFYKFPKDQILGP